VHHDSQGADSLFYICNDSEDQTGIRKEVTQRSDATVAATKVAFHQAILGRRRIDFRDEALIADCDA
jgi:hypothetical protein